MQKVRGRAISLFGVLLSCCACAFGLDPALETNQYAHKAWTVSDGFFKGSIYAIAQTPDGYLWIGTEYGLERFDGVRSVAWQPAKGEHLPGGRVRSLLAVRDGRLWVGTDEGLSSLKDGNLTQYPEFAGKTVLSLLEDHQATIWAAVWGVGSKDGRLCSIREGRVECQGNDGRLSNGMDGLYEDRAGRLWAGGVDGVWRWKPEPAKFFPMPIVTSSFAEDDSGKLFVTTLEGINTIADEHAGPYLVRAAGQQAKFGKLLRDRDGGLWAGTYDGGLLHVHRGRIDRFTQSDGLSSDNVLYLFEDREGSIWVGTRNGLDRFREFIIPTISEKQGLSNSMVDSLLEGRDGSIWLGTLNGLDRWKNGYVDVYGTQHGLPDPSVLSLFEGQSGRIWVSTRRGVAYLERDKFVRVPNISGSVVCIVGDGAGGIWISDQLKLYHLQGQSIVEEIPWSKLGHKDFAWTILPDSVRGGLWLGFRQGGVAFFQDHAIRSSYGREQGFGDGRVSGLKLDADGSVWAATGDGLGVIRNGGTLRLSSANGLPCDMVHWVVEDNDHSLWLYTSCGLVRIERSELEKWVADPKRKVSTTTFDSADGVRSGVVPTDSNPTVAKSVDGKIWFVPKGGVSIIDPHHLAFNKLPPPVHIEQVTADDKSYEAANGLRLPPRVRYLAIDYTALSFVAPEKVRFRYKLEGEDKDWREVVNDRNVQYTNLAPKHYRFRVLACNNSGVWNEQGASLEFVVPPAWYQTRWFYALCATAFLLMLWGLYRLRVLQLQREFNATLEGRVGERTRVARDIHDTLLQSFHGLMLRFGIVDRLLPGRAEEAKKELQRAMALATAALTEGRDAVQALRSSTIETNDLVRAIQTIGEELAGKETNKNGASFAVRVEGASRDLRPLLRDEAYRIATEALRNAFRHANARRVEVEIRYGEKQFRLRVVDDGKGIASTVLSGSGPAGHYGLPGMRERAQLVGGKLAVWSEAEGGTEIELTIPARNAYEAGQGTSWWAQRFAAKASDAEETKIES